MRNLITALRSWINPDPAWEDNPFIHVNKGGGIRVDADKYFEDEQVQKEIEDFFRVLNTDNDQEDK